jgi:hypothetical protein
VIPGQQLRDLLIIQQQYSLKSKNWTREHSIILQWTHVQNEPRKRAADTFCSFFFSKFIKRVAAL